MGGSTHATLIVPAGGALEDRWFRRFALPSAKARLFCLPYAGGSAGIYRNWHDWMAPEVEVVAVELPGRGIHMRRAPLDRMEALTEALADAMRPLLDLPFAIFGHSMGGLVGFELSRALARDHAAAPVHLFVSAIEPPHLFSSRMSLHDLPQGELIAALRGFNAAAAEAFQNQELAEILLPVVRADFRLVETYRYAAGAALRHPITAFGGLADASTPAHALEAWREHTTESCMIRLLAGDHFFIHDYEHLLAASVARSLHRAGSPSP
ncbi:MAG TPA: alpha/beta fold hydrolase [Vicinamibacteria bacterium]|jgi:medium-chain acyl-[acyl-carrier-protein] hydrolase